jgi:integrase
LADPTEILGFRSLRTNETDTPKSGHGRTVDVSKGLRVALRRLRAKAGEAALRRGDGTRDWLFPAKDGGPMPHITAQVAFKRALQAAELPGSFSCHSLRHTYASLLLAAGVSPAYVQEQLGHASIELTVGTDGGFGSGRRGRSTSSTGPKW